MDGGLTVQILREIRRTDARLGQTREEPTVRIDLADRVFKCETDLADLERRVG